MAVQIADMIGVEPQADKDGFYRGISKLAKMGNNAPIACVREILLQVGEPTDLLCLLPLLHLLRSCRTFTQQSFGGCVMASCMSAAFATLPQQPDYELYSVLGNFLGPGSIEVYTKYEVEDIRTTKTFATRKVIAWQDLNELPADSKTKRPPPGQGLRRIMIMLVDFQVREKASLFDYSPLPIHATPPPATYTIKSGFSEHRPVEEFKAAVEASYGSPSTLASHEDYLHSNFSDRTIKAYQTMFPLFARFFTSRPVTSSLASETMMGFEAKRAAKQDVEPIQRRTNSLWWKGRDDMDFSKKGVNEAATAFLMDGALAFLPLTFSK